MRRVRQLARSNRPKARGLYLGNDMANGTIEQKLQRLDELPIDAKAFMPALKKALASKHYRMLAKAAHLCQVHYLDQCIPELVAAYATLLLGDAVKKDRTCYAKTALCEALYELNYVCEDFYLAGMRYRQMEPVWGGHVDSALNIRRICAMGLTITRCPRMHVELLTVLYDEDASVRAGAVAAIACLQPGIAEPILRQKVLGGDEPWVLGACFSALLQIEPDENIGFVVSFLNNENEELLEYAALSLGESRLNEAFAGLKQAWVDCHLNSPKFHQMLLSGMVLHRSDAAYAHLLQVIQQDERGLAAETLTQLAIYRDNAALKQQVRDLVSHAQRRDLSEVFAQRWG